MLKIQQKPKMRTALRLYVANRAGKKQFIELQTGTAARHDFTVRPSYTFISTGTCIENYCTCTNPYRTITGTTTIKKVGVAIQMTIIVATTVKRDERKSEKDLGSVSSTVLMSLENLLRMWPRGVVSKKDMGERKMLKRSFLCSPLEAK